MPPEVNRIRGLATAGALTVGRVVTVSFALERSIVITLRMTGCGS
jgi:hypothetical protein